MAPRNRTRLNLRIVDEGRRAPERALPLAPEHGDLTGAFLRAWREHRGWTIDQVAWVLRIRLVYLEAIENDRFEELPGRIYVTGFVRSYAKLLGIDDAAVVRQLRARHPEVDRPKELVFPEPPAERAVPGGALTAVGMMIAVAVYAGWYYQTANSGPDRAFVGSVPSRLLATAEPSGSGVGGLDRNALPAAVPMQPPMRPPPTRTVVQAPAPVDAAGAPRIPVASTSMPRSVEPESAPSMVAEAPSPEIPRGDPPQAGAARNLQVALAGAGQPLPGSEAQQFAGAADPRLGPAQVADARSDAPSVAPYSQGVPVSTAREAWPTRTGSPGEMAARRPGAPSAPALPSAEMADAYAATLPVDMIPVIRDGDINRPQASSSASAAWAGSVDGFPAGQWRPPQAERADIAGPIVLNAVEATWIEVREETGQVVTGKLLQPGDSYTVPSRPGLKLTTGNAGGLEILVGGRPAPRVGPRGAVRRDIDLDGRLLLAGQTRSG